MHIAIFILLLTVILLLLVLHGKKKKIIKDMCGMSSYYKNHLLNELAKPMGYRYNPRQDIFTSTQDAWQKHYGYRDLYDRMAPYLNMIFDCQPIYFDYDKKTWLIEFWKGQYGINTGSEVGVYHADTIIPPSERKMTTFHAAAENEYLYINSILYHNDRFLAETGAPHWWSALFSVGHFANPKNLTLNVSIRFPNLDMRDAFLDALFLNGYDTGNVHICFNVVSFTFHPPRRPGCLLKKIYRLYVQLKNRLFCKLYCFVTRPFKNTCDKLLYLYYYLPFIFRRMLRPRRYKKRYCQHRQASLATGSNWRRHARKEN